MNNSVTAELAGILYGPKAAAVIGALQSMGREKWRSMAGGFPHEIMHHTSMLACDVNPAICDLLLSGLLRRKGSQIVVVVNITEDEAVRILPGIERIFGSRGCR